MKYFENIDDFPRGFFKGKRVLELGAGTGVVGIALGLLGNKQF
jgi:predicted RNA methylase